MIFENFSWETGKDNWSQIFSILQDTKRSPIHPHAAVPFMSPQQCKHTQTHTHTRGHARTHSLVQLSSRGHECIPTHGPDPQTFLLPILGSLSHTDCPGLLLVQPLILGKSSIKGPGSLWEVHLLEELLLDRSMASWSWQGSSWLYYILADEFVFWKDFIGHLGIVKIDLGCLALD